MQPTRTRIAFALESAAEVGEWQTKLHEIGALNVDPSNDMDDYPAIFFEDPVGTRLEVCARRKRTTT
jgi:predicted lactoylglutathione lyase